MNEMKPRKRPAGIYVALGIIVLGVGLSILADLLENPFMRSLGLVLPCGLTGYAISVYIFDVKPFKTRAGLVFFAAIILLVTVAFWLIDIS